MNPILPTLTHDALKPWFDKPALINDCVAQVQKDLGSYGIEIRYSGNHLNAYEELFLQLQPQLEKLLHSGTKLIAILYRVDINEKEVRKAADNQEDMSHALARLILWRELQKVVTRFLLKDPLQ